MYRSKKLEKIANGRSIPQIAQEVRETQRGSRDQWIGSEGYKNDVYFLKEIIKKWRWDHWDSFDLSVYSLVRAALEYER